MTIIVDDILWKKWNEEIYENGTIAGIPIHNRPLKNNENMNNMFSAEEARRKTKNAEEKNINKLMEDIYISINKACNDIHRWCYFNSLSDLQQKYLRSQGFQIQYIEGDPRDPREHSQYKVSW